MKKIFGIIKLNIFVFILCLAFFSPYISLAQDWTPETPPSSPLTGLKEIQKNVGEELMPSTNPVLWIVRAFNYFLTFLGVVFLLMIIYSGYTLMTAGGNDEKVKKGKTILQTAIIGLVIVILARIIYIFVENRLAEWK